MSYKTSRKAAKKTTASAKAKVRLPKTSAPLRTPTGMPIHFFAAITALGVLAGAALSQLFPIETPAGSVTGNVVEGQVIDIGANNAPFAQVDEQMPFEAIHWHAHIVILAAGSEITMPAGIGIDIGNNTDNDISGVAASPIHTHEVGGTIHIENLAPRLYREQLTLGYFFNKVWNKKFSSECILEYCNGPGGIVKMFVNGKENSEYEKYAPKDGGEIVISYDLP